MALRPDRRGPRRAVREPARLHGHDGPGRPHAVHVLGQAGSGHGDAARPAGLGHLQRWRPGHPAQHARHARVDCHDVGRPSARAPGEGRARARPQRHRRVPRHLPQPGGAVDRGAAVVAPRAAVRSGGVLRRGGVRPQHDRRRLWRLDAQGPGDRPDRTAAGRRRAGRDHRLSTFHLRAAGTARRRLVHPGDGGPVRHRRGVHPDGERRRASNSTAPRRRPTCCRRARRPGRSGCTGCADR